MAVKRQKKSTTTTVKKTKVVDNRKKWKKLGGGSLYIGNRIIKENEVFLATEEEISPAFRDNIVPVGHETPTSVELSGKTTTTTKAKAPVYKKVVVEGEEDKFDVVDGKGKKQNEKPLTEEEADEIIKTLID